MPGAGVTRLELYSSCRPALIFTFSDSYRPLNAFVATLHNSTSRAFPPPLCEKVTANVATFLPFYQLDFDTRFRKTPRIHRGYRIYFEAVFKGRNAFAHAHTVGLQVLCVVLHLVYRFVLWGGGCLGSCLQRGRREQREMHFVVLVFLAALVAALAAALAGLFVKSFPAPILRNMSVAPPCSAYCLGYCLNSVSG